MERRVNLTKRTVDALRSSDPDGEQFSDSRLRGFQLLVYASGAKVFAVRYRVGRHRRRITIGPYGEWTVEKARSRAEEILLEARKGHDPKTVRQRARLMPTFEEWAKTYLERVRLVKKSPREDLRFLPMAVARWGSLPLDQITPEHVEAAREALKKTKTQANRFLASVRSCLSSAVRSGHILANPAKALKPYRENAPRARTLTPDEMERLLRALDQEDVFVRAAFRMLVETGARLSEVLKAKWEDVDLPAGTWRIPSPKSGTPQILPLATSTRDLLKRLPRVGPWVIPGRDPEKRRPDLRFAWEKLCTVANLENVHVHDLRRTFGLAVARSAGLHVASKLLRHADVRVTERVYAPLGLEDLRAAIEHRAEVLPFPAKREA